MGAAIVSSQGEILCAAGARIGIENLPGKKNKFAVIDVEGDDPVVILGSYNRTKAGAYDNDENTLIIHHRELARAYDAEGQRLWATVPVERVCNTNCLPGNRDIIGSKHHSRRMRGPFRYRLSGKKTLTS
jgi:hypothetical protein